MSLYTKSRPWFTETPTGFITTEPLSWEIGRKESGLWVQVPKDFSFDVSIPKALTWLFDPREVRFLKAAALHDYLLENNWNRIAAGAVFYEALTADNVNKWEKLSMWAAVSIWKWK